MDSVRRRKWANKNNNKNIVQPTSGGYTDTFNYGNFKLFEFKRRNWLYKFHR